MNAWQGQIDLVYERKDEGTAISHVYYQAPLKVQRPFYPEGQGVCHSVILHTAGGIVGGDRLGLNFHLKPQAQSLITTATAGKIYRSDRLVAEQTVLIKLEDGAHLEYFPQETIIFDGAKYRQDLRLELAATASLFLWDITRFGRTARGERFLTGTWRSNLEIYQNQTPIWIDRQHLTNSSLIGEGNHRAIDSPVGLAGQPIVASFIYIGADVTPLILTQIRELWTNQSGEFGVTALTNGLLCRYRGQSTTQVRRWFIDIWHLLRSQFHQRPSCVPRVWP